jgi:hypothetical protein
MCGGAGAPPLFEKIWTPEPLIGQGGLYFIRSESQNQNMSSPPLIKPYAKPHKPEIYAKPLV